MGTRRFFLRLDPGTPLPQEGTNDPRQGEARPSSLFATAAQSEGTPQVFGETALDPGAGIDRNGLEILSRAECVALLATTPVGRIVYTERALPAIRPVNFVVHDDMVVIRTSGRGSLAASADGAVVAFEADQFTDTPRTGWSVAVLGRAREVTNPDHLRELEALGLRAWTPVLQDRFLVISIEAISGRRIPACRG